MRAIRRAVPFAMALAVLLGCGGSPDPAPPAPLPATTVPAAQAAAGGFSVTDTAWLQLAIAMDERALTVLDLVPARTTDPGLKDLARRLATEHRDELTRLRALHARSGGPTANPHEGHDMPGMATGETVKALRVATGTDAAYIFATAMRAHIDQSIRLAQAEQKSGSDPGAKALAADIERSRTDQRGRLDAL
ncbi:DUF305 domain-containing protein [Phytohabitans sp. ZYX-F-186]|uniref:DUF305 domain-containing protein n=1 Tax=Phytohabitans maris TaxID=3071409 RepID=A0ABU0ZF19_9ACTN|nr:DUF305 domain-containing protein [Phytohabitans sp. ZYX-F-186]MDQ7905573.1 DUF305 domain-containing protein [Phytohabitans sp. ZYX-F-186]